MSSRYLAAFAAAALVALGAATLPSTDARAASAKSDARKTAQRTERYIRAFERRDLATVRSALDARVTLVHPITFSGELRPD